MRVPGLAVEQSCPVARCHPARVLLVQDAGSDCPPCSGTLPDRALCGQQASVLATAASASESSLDEADLELLGAQSRAPVAHSSAEGVQAVEAVDVIEVSSLVQAGTARRSGSLRGSGRQQRIAQHLWP